VCISGISFINKLPDNQAEVFVKRIWIICMLIFSVTCANAGEVEDQNIGFIKSVTGTVALIRAGLERKVEAGQHLLATDTIVTGPLSSAGVIFEDGTVLTLGAGTSVEMREYLFHPKDEQYGFELYMKKGEVIYSSGKLGKLAPEKVNIKTPRATVGVRGTRFLLSIR
jgi:hypothetical protein